MRDASPLFSLLPVLVFAALSSACSGSGSAPEAPVAMPAPASPGAPPAAPIMVRPAPARATIPDTAVAPAAAAPVAIAPAAGGVTDGGAAALVAPTPDVESETPVVRSGATPIQEPAPVKAPGERFLVGKVQSDEQFVDDAARARDEIVRQLSRRPDSKVLSDEEVERAQDMAHRTNPACVGTACLPTVAILLKADALVSGSLAREHHEYVLTISIARPHAAHPSVTSERMHHLRNLSLNVGLCLDRLLASASP